MSIPDAAQGAKDHLADTTHDWARDLDAGHLVLEVRPRTCGSSTPQAAMLPDGHPRRGMSVVTALSQWVMHTNLRREGAWAQRYERGTGLTPIPGDGTTGNTSSPAQPCCQTSRSIYRNRKGSQWPSARTLR